MKTKTVELVELYDALLKQVKSDYSDDNTMTVKELLAVVSRSKQYLELKSSAKENELALVEHFLKRDIASFLQEQNDHDLGHSPTMIAASSTLWHWLGGITDRSQIEWHEVIQDFKHEGQYHSGEVIAQGKLICTHCNHEMEIEFPGLIPDCPKCDRGEFNREALAP